MVTDPLDHEGGNGPLIAELHVQPGGRVVTAHRHPDLVERFHVLRGEIGFLIGDREELLGPGRSAEVPAEVVHDWWQVGDEEAVVIVEVNPGARFVEMVATFFGLARDGKVDKKGMPGPLQLALSAKHFSDTMVVAKPPPWAQSMLFGAMAPIARMRGLKPTYEEYLTSNLMAEPDPAALELVGEDGRLRFDAG